MLNRISLSNHEHLGTDASQDGIHKWEWSLGPPNLANLCAAISATDSVMRLLADLKVGNADSGFILPGTCHGFIDPDRFETDIWRPIVKRAELTGTSFTTSAPFSRAS